MKRYGISGHLPPGDPMCAPHLLGDQWEWIRWYASETERDAALREMTRPFAYYRRGDRPSQLLTAIEQEL